MLLMYIIRTSTCILISENYKIESQLLDGGSYIKEKEMQRYTECA